MLGFVIQRTLQAAMVMAVMSVLVFCGVYAIGNPVDIMIPPDATQQLREETIAKLGLDKPLYIQYFTFVGNLLHGDFGRSFVYNIPVLELIGGRLPATLELVLISVITATVLGVTLGIYAGYKPDSWISRAIMIASVLGFSVPSFWVGLILILTFAVNLNILPAGGRGQTVEVFGIPWSFLTIDGLRHIALPAINLALFKLSMMIRLARAGTREIMLSDTIKFARAAGISERVILSRHLLKLISIPIVTVFGLELGSTLAFAVVTETIFSWPGVGKLIIDSIGLLDRPVMVAYLILVALLFVTINFTIDFVFALIDPRLRHGGKA
ncbi:ABC transporter permease [Roseibium polysiphoniae]|uniref:ABC transporter permease n=1 Tax=Roseibium polysiphoniae TaxID=2571221 RepID=A0A944CHM4_9HYPH|nr:ABC transporter permease [Roseibium polysiphoniae]MBS8262757.1 ABC transporter permease [Roseibium polysiphoniae]